MKTLFSTLILFCTLIAGAQNNFHKLYTVAGGAQCSHIAMTSTGNGNAILAYHYVTGPNAYIGIQDVDTVGHLLWAKAYQLPVASFVPITMVGTPDSGAILALEDTFQMSTIQLWKINKLGGIQWAKSFPANHFAIYQVPLAVMSDGNIFLAHANHDSLSLTKIDPLGNITWDRNYNVASGSGVNPNSIVNNGTAIYISGYEINSYTGYLVKTDTSGNILWQKNGFGVSASLNLTPAPTGGGIIASTTNVYPTKIGAVDAAGAISWDTGIALRSPKMIRINNNSIALCIEDSSIIKTVIMDTLGVIREAISYRDSLASDDIAVAAITNAGFWVSSVNNDKVWLMKAGIAGNTGCFSQSYTISTQPDSFATGNLALSTNPPITAFSNIVLTPQNISVNDSTLCGNLGISTLKNVEPVIYPNPVTDELTIRQAAGATGTVRITDVLGKLIFQTSMKGETIINTSNWQQGLYFIQLLDANGTVDTHKVLKL